MSACGACSPGDAGTVPSAQRSLCSRTGLGIPKPHSTRPAGDTARTARRHWVRVKGTMAARTGDTAQASWTLGEQCRAPREQEAPCSSERRRVKRRWFTSCTGSPLTERTRICHLGILQKVFHWPCNTGGVQFSLQ